MFGSSPDVTHGVVSFFHPELAPVEVFDRKYIPERPSDILLGVLEADTLIVLVAMSEKTIPDIGSMAVNAEKLGDGRLSPLLF